MNSLPKDQAFWNGLFSMLFGGLFLFLFWGLTDGLDNFTWLYLITTMDVVIISLATFRIIRLVSYDKIFAFVRHWFLVRQEDGTYKKQGGGPRRTVAELLECVWCTGLWASLFVTALYFADGIGRFAVLILAIAAVGSFMQIFSQMIGRIGSHD